MANTRNCDLTGTPIQEGEPNYGRGSHLVTVDDGIHLTVTAGRRDGGNQGVDLSSQGFALALRKAAESLLQKLVEKANAKAEAMEAVDAAKAAPESTTAATTGADGTPAPAVP